MRRGRYRNTQLLGRVKTASIPCAENWRRTRPGLSSQERPLGALVGRARRLYALRPGWLRLKGSRSACGRRIHPHISKVSSLSGPYAVSHHKKKLGPSVRKHCNSLGPGLGTRGAPMC